MESHSFPPRKVYALMNILREVYTSKLMAGIWCKNVLLEWICLPLLSAVRNIARKQSCQPGGRTSYFNVQLFGSHPTKRNENLRSYLNLFVIWLVGSVSVDAETAKWQERYAPFVGVPSAPGPMAKHIAGRLMTICGIICHGCLSSTVVIDQLVKSLITTWHMFIPINVCIWVTFCKTSTWGGGGGCHEFTPHWKLGPMADEEIIGRSQFPLQPTNLSKQIINGRLAN